jgi:hypothetical protein
MAVLWDRQLSSIPVSKAAFPLSADCVEKVVVEVA